MARKPTERGNPISPAPSSHDAYFDIVAPGLDHIDPQSFRKGSVEGRRAKRGLIVLAIMIGVVAVVALVGTLVSTMM